MQAGRGVCLWFTGRSGAGKSTVTAALVPLLEQRGRMVSVYDVVPLLARSRWERGSEGKLLRKAFVAGEVARHGGIAVCVTVSARARVRAAAREIVGAQRFVEVYADADPEITAARKRARTKRPPLRKRIRRAVRRARATGRHALGRPVDGYEVPEAPDLVLDTVSVDPRDNARAILDLLVARGIVAPDPDVDVAPGGDVDVAPGGDAGATSGTGRPAANGQR